MEFVHPSYSHEETIAAIATAPGEGGVAMVRISGACAIDVAALCFSGPVHQYKSHTAHFGKICDANGTIVDEVLLLVMLAPRSYTGENTVEIHCHGGRLITRRVFETILAAGAQAAAPGEFTLRAFLNGKIDLAQAEAVQALIGAKNEMALDASANQLQGKLSRSIAQFQQALTQTAAILEAWVDFPEEDLEFASAQQICDDLEIICVQMENLATSFHNGRLVHDGVALCLVGSPNVGKSSLMNALLDKDRAIVSPYAGTTRDVLEDHMRLNGLNIKISDTAGIRETAEIIEQEGIRRSKQAMQTADLILLVLDIQAGLTSSDQELLQLVPKDKTIIVWNKNDLAHLSPPDLDHFPATITISAKDGTGLAKLHKIIDDILWQAHPPAKDEVMITNIRHHEALVKAALAARAVQNGLLNNTSPEFLTFDMRQALSELGQILGTNITEDILSAIFSKFCIGK